MRLKDHADKVTDLLQVNPAKIQFDPGYNVQGREFNPDADALDLALLDSIRQSGVRTPITIRADGETIVVVAGHRRLSAVRLLLAEGVDIKTIPCMPEARGTSEADRALDLLTSNDSKPLTALQEAEIYKRLMGHGWDLALIARKAARSITHIHNRLDLAAAPAEVLAMVADGAVSVSTAVATVRAEGSGAGKVLAEAAAASPSGKVTPKALRKPVAEAPVAPTANRTGVQGKLDAILDQLTAMETDTSINVRVRKGIERARVAVADAWDLAGAV